MDKEAVMQVFLWFMAINEKLDALVETNPKACDLLAKREKGYFATKAAFEDAFRKESNMPQREAT